jgi:hypothetical protein
MGIDLAVRTRAEGGVAVANAEKVLQTDGREVMRLLLQGLMDLVVGQEERRRGGVLGSDGVARTHVEKDHSRGVATTSEVAVITAVSSPEVGVIKSPVTGSMMSDMSCSIPPNAHARRVGPDFVTPLPGQSRFAKPRRRFPPGFGR